MYFQTCKQGIVVKDNAKEEGKAKHLVTGNWLNFSIQYDN